MSALAADAAAVSALCALWDRVDTGAQGMRCGEASAVRGGHVS